MEIGNGFCDSRAKEGSIDDDGYVKPENREKTGGWRAGSLLLVSEGLAALAFTGVEVNMVLFAKLVLRQSNAEAASTFSTWMGTLNICTLFGAFLSDSYLGRHMTCVVFQVVLIIGLVLLSLSTQEFMLEPKGCGKNGVLCNQPSPAKTASFYISVYLLALGSGAIEPALAALGADQFDEDDSEENKSKTTFFSYYYVALNVGSLIAETVLVYIENLGKWVLAFWISTFCGFLALVSLLVGTSRYRHTRPCGNPISRFSQVIVACVRKVKLDVPSRGEGLYEDGCTRRILHTDDFKCLDRAAVVTPSERILLSRKGQTPNPWNLCTVTQVEEVKCVLRLLPIWCCSIVASIVFVQVLSLFVEQGSVMDTKISNFHIPPASMTAFDIISTSTFIICYEKVIVPLYVKLMKRSLRTPTELQRMGIGMVISILAMIVAGLVEQGRLKYANGRETSSLSIFWQIPQYVLVGVSEAFIYVAQWEFFASQIPEGLKSFGLGLSMSSSALGSYLCSIIVTLVMKVTSKHGKPGWISPNLNEGHMDRFFFLSAALIALDLALFITCANRFKCMQQEKRGGVKEAPAVP
ncbi:protein NRT1/ PTR FAMILY 7.3-like isoform X2 [Andrographis paniculata]|uniref:protein NRT1/ PTR FAMILY 7.3-like isoform X2 n=1 Tax=Andrographis paniculata TaxID=175694 RepID=UPI0021E78EBD|nr:protein NRT1/ PTR FAMILY 7.3-like isoform X2 [Andrographis paniculata]